MNSFVKKTQIYIISSLVFAAVLFLSSCTAAGSSTGDPDNLVPPAFTANPSPGEDVAETTSPEPDITLTVRPDLHATDPKVVMLASGKPQLIEFFAYW